MVSGLFYKLFCSIMLIGVKNRSPETVMAPASSQTNLKIKSRISKGLDF